MSRAFTTLFILLLVGVSVCFGEQGQQDQLIVGKSVRKLRKIMTIYPVFDADQYKKELGTSNPLGAWVNQNYVPGTRWFYYERHLKTGRTNGWCVSKRGVVINSIIWQENVPEIHFPTRAEFLREWNQRSLERQQTAHERDKDIIMMVTVYPDLAIPRTAGFFVKANGLFTEFLEGSGRGNEMGELGLPPEAIQKLRSLLSELPEPGPESLAMRIVVSFLDHDIWTTRIYDGKQDRDTLQAILRIPTENNSGYGSIFTDYVLLP